MFTHFSVEVKPDIDAFVDLITGKKPAGRVHHAELFLDEPIETAVAKRFGLDEGLDTSSRWYMLERRVKVLRFLGYDYAYEYNFEGMEFPHPTDHQAADTAQSDQSKGERSWVDESKGPVTTWEEFEKYPWPEPGKFDISTLEWFEENLPDDMGMTSGDLDLFEQLTRSMGIESLSYALYDTPDLVKAIIDRVGEIFVAAAKTFVQFSKMKFIFGGDDLGYKTGTLVSPDDIRKYALPWHKKIVQVLHDAGRPYVFHSCGNIEAVMPDLINDVKIDAIHSFEDAIEPVEEFYKRWGDKIAVVGGVDVDLLCRASEEAIRKRVRQILSVCHPNRYALGTGNSVANYIPLDNYLAMLDEGRKYSG